MVEKRPSAREVDCPVYLHPSNDQSGDHDQKEEQRISVLSRETKEHLLGRTTETRIEHGSDVRSDKDLESSDHKQHRKSSRKKRTTDESPHKRSAKGNRSPSSRKHRTQETEKTHCREEKTEVSIAKNTELSPAKETAEDRKGDRKTNKTDKKSSRRSNVATKDDEHKSPSRRRRSQHETSRDKGTPKGGLPVTAETVGSSPKHRSRRDDRSPSHKKHHSRKESSQGHENRKKESRVRSRTREESEPSSSLDHQLSNNAKANELLEPSCGEKIDPSKHRNDVKSHRHEPIAADQNRSPHRKSRHHQDDTGTVVKIEGCEPPDLTPSGKIDKANDEKKAHSHRHRAENGGKSHAEVSKAGHQDEVRPKGKHRSRHKKEGELKPTDTLSSAKASSHIVDTDNERDRKRSPPQRKHRRSKGPKEKHKEAGEKGIDGELLDVSGEKPLDSILHEFRPQRDTNMLCLQSPTPTQRLDQESKPRTSAPLPADADRDSARHSKDECPDSPQPEEISAETVRDDDHKSPIDRTSDESMVEDELVDKSLGTGKIQSPGQGKENRSPNSANRKLTSKLSPDRHSQDISKHSRKSDSSANIRSNPLEKSPNDNNAKSYGGFTAELKQSERLVTRASSLRQPIPRSKSGCEIVAAASSMRGQLHRSQSLILRRQSSDKRLDGSFHRRTHATKSDCIAERRPKSDRIAERRPMKPIQETLPESSTRTQRSCNIRKSTSRARKSCMGSGKRSNVKPALAKPFENPPTTTKDVARKSPSCRPRKLESRIRRAGRIRVADDASATPRLNDDAHKFSITW